MIHFVPSESGLFRKFFLMLYAKFEIPYLRFNYLVIKYAFKSKFWKAFFMPLVYLNAFIMLRYGQHGHVMTVKEIEDMLKGYDKILIAVGSCRCRVASPEACNCEIKTDITIRLGADVYKRNFPEDYKVITKREAIEMIREFNRKGLIPTVYTFCMCGGAQYKFVICNCCSHACIPMLAQRIAKFYTFTPGKYLAKVNQDKCIGCGDCVTICQLDARRIVNGKAKVNPYLCVGCGACAEICKSNATEMIERPPEILEKQIKSLRRFSAVPTEVHVH
ncbi:MAG: 4Fe-4S binding protein [Candidatus Asgardarchaeia archaeon]